MCVPTRSILQSASTATRAAGRRSWPPWSKPRDGSWSARTTKALDDDAAGVRLLATQLPGLWRRHVRKMSASIPSASDVPGAGQRREERCPGRGAHGARRAPLYSMHCDGRAGFRLSRARDGTVLAPELSREHIAIIRRAYGVYIVEDRRINVAGY